MQVAPGAASMQESGQRPFNTVDGLEAHVTGVYVISQNTRENTQSHTHTFNDQSSGTAARARARAGPPVVTNTKLARGSGGRPVQLQVAGVFCRSSMQHHFAKNEARAQGRSVKDDGGN